MKIASIIPGVTRPVNVFCWLRVIAAEGEQPPAVVIIVAGGLAPSAPWLPTVVASHDRLPMTFAHANGRDWRRERRAALRAAFATSRLG